MGHIMTLRHPLQYDKPLTQSGRTPGNGGLFAGSSGLISCCVCHTHRPTNQLEQFRKGLTLRRCKDREGCAERKTAA